MRLGMKVDPRSLPTFGARSEAAQFLCPKLSYIITADSKWSAGYVDRHWTSGCVVSTDTNLVILPTSFKGVLYVALNPESMPDMRVVLSMSRYAAASSVSVETLTRSYEVQGERERYSNFSF